MEYVKTQVPGLPAGTLHIFGFLLQASLEADNPSASQRIKDVLVQLDSQTLNDWQGYFKVGIEAAAAILDGNVNVASAKYDWLSTNYNFISGNTGAYCVAMRTGLEAHGGSLRVQALLGKVTILFATGHKSYALNICDAIIADQTESDSTKANASNLRAALASGKTISGPQNGAMQEVPNP